MNDIVTNQILLQGPKCGRLYRIQSRVAEQIFSAVSMPQDNSCSISDTTLIDLWHKRLGHPSNIILASCLKDFNQSVSRTKSFSLCNACALGKAQKLPFSVSTSVYITPLELVVTTL